MQRNNAVVLQCGATCNIQQCAAWCGQGCDVARHSLRESVVEESICEREYIGVPRVVLDHLLCRLLLSIATAQMQRYSVASFVHCVECSSTRSKLPVAPHRCSLLTSTTPNSAIHSRHLQQCLRLHGRSQLQCVAVALRHTRWYTADGNTGKYLVLERLGYSRGTLGVLYLVLERVGVL